AGIDVGEEETGRELGCSGGPSGLTARARAARERAAAVLQALAVADGVADAGGKHPVVLVDPGEQLAARVALVGGDGLLPLDDVRARDDGAGVRGEVRARDLVVARTDGD